jgi:DNA polymerase III alpha subunit
VNRWSRRLPWLATKGPGGEVAEADEERTAGDAPHGSSSGGAGSPTGEVPPSPSFLPRAWRANPVACALAATPECRAFPFDDPRWRPVLEGAAALYDAPRHLGLHPGGVVVAPRSITELVSCQRATKGVVMTQLDKDGVEAIGLVKMDLLGNRALTVIDDCTRLLADRDVEVDLSRFPEDDPRTATLLEHGRTLGCSQVESPGMRNLLKQTGARTTDDVIQSVALIRPGPAGSGMKDAYVRRFRGVEEPTPPHPRLRELLWDTHGVMLYQEDVMQTVVLLSGMDLGQADQLRRALSKRRSKTLERLRGQFFAGCGHEGITAEDARRVWQLVENFASFAFCKAHAVTYGRIAYRTVWLKAHHPAAYMTAFLNSQTGYYATRVYVEEARRLGVAILPPDVNKSLAEFRLEPGRSPDEPAAIRVGLGRVKGLTEGTLERLLDGREVDGPYLSLPDFLARTRARVDETERLIQCGAFDAFDRTRPEMLWRLHLLRGATRRPPKERPGDAPLDAGLLAACRMTPEERERTNARESAHAANIGWRGKGIGVGGLDVAPGASASLFPEPETPALALPALPELDLLARGRLEMEILSLTIATHPTALFPAPADERLQAARESGHPPRPPREIPCRELDRHRGRRVTLRGWRAASRRVRTVDGRWMRFLTLEDESGVAEAVLFADVYERDGHLLAEEGTLVVSGRVEDQLGACTLHAERVW